MRIILKNSLKNIFKKPFRTLLMAVTIFICVFTALFCIDMAKSLERLVDQMYGNIATADIMIESQRPIELPSDLPENKTFVMGVNRDRLIKEIPGEPAFVDTEEYKIFGLDPKQASEMGIIDDSVIGDGEVILNNRFADSNGWKIGDTLELHDRAGEKHSFTVKNVITDNANNPLLRSGNIAVVNEASGNMLSCGVRDSEMMFIKLTDETKIDSVVEQLKVDNPRADVSTLKINAEDRKALDEIMMFMYIVFAISFLLVIFVTISISERIVSERMAFIGTLRSLGMSMNKTGLILLLENFIYALLGAIPGIVTYLLVRTPIMDTIMQLQTADGQVIKIEATPISALLVIIVFFGAILVECVVPLRAIMKALKISIRDIIFDNRDTEYKYSKKMLIAGLVFLLISVVSIIFSTHLVAALICFVSLVFALALLFPWVFKTLSNLLRKRDGNAKWKLAMTQASARKSTIGSGVMCVTAAALCVVIFAVAAAQLDSLVYTEYNYDVSVNCNCDASYFSFIDYIDGVTETERVYSCEFKPTCIGEEERAKETTFFGMPDGGYQMFNELLDLPEHIAKDEVCINKRLASSEGIKIGDTIKVTIDPESVVPFVRELKVISFYEGRGSSEAGRAMVLSEDAFIELFHGNPSKILIRCEDPQKVANIIKTYGKDCSKTCKTVDEMIEEDRAGSSGMITLLFVMIAGGLGMTLIGVISNQLIGFEGRKKECAVLLSTAMNKKILSGILFREALLMSSVAGIIGTLIGVVLSHVFANAIEHSSSLYMQISADPIKCAIFCIILILVFSLTVLFPIRNLRRMKIAEQIKYE